MQNEIDLKVMGKRIKDGRLKVGLSQEKLAEMVNLSVPHLSKVENGHKSLSLDVAVKIANVIDVSIDFLVREAMDDAMKTFNAEVNCIVEDCTEEELSRLLKLLRTCKEVIR